jgi:hypothetical protein
VTNDPQELGKGIFGYRKSAVNQILADRDIMLRQAEGRVRAAESKVAELETELVAMQERNSRMDEQLDRLRTQFDALAARTDTPPSAEPVVPVADASVPPQPESEPEPEPAPEPAPSWHEAPTPDLPHDEHADTPFPFGESDAEFAGLDGGATEVPLKAPSPEHEYLVSGPSIFDQPAEQADVSHEAAHLPGHYAFEDASADQTWPVPDPHLASPPEGESGSDMDFVYGSSDYSYQPEAHQAEPHDDPYAFAFEETPDVTEPADDLPPVMTFEGDDMSSTFESNDVPEPWEPSQPSDDSAASALAEAAAAAAAAASAAAEAGDHETPISLSEEPARAESAPTAEASAPQPEAAETTPQQPGVSSETIDLTNRFLTDEIQGILAAAEESAARIVERARATTQHQIAQSNRLWREVQAEVSRFATWREQVEPVIRSVQAKVERVRAHIEDVPDRIREALAPMADTISTVDADLAELAAASSPPLLLTPRGLDAQDDHPDAWPMDPFEGHAEEASYQDPGADAEDADRGDSSGHLAG